LKINGRRRDTILEDGLLDLLERLAAFVIQLLEPVEAVATISHHLASAAS
jgi:hypothetical protein